MLPRTLSDRQLSIESFFKSDVQSDSRATREKTFEQGDGFTNVELMKALDPLSSCWNPGREYKKMALNQLQPGPRAVTFMGKIVNINTRFGKSSEQPRAKGWHYIIIKDDMVTITIKLYFAVTPYPLRLGHLLTLWTSFISETPINDEQYIGSSTLRANIFPGRVASDHFLIHDDTVTTDIYNLPLRLYAGIELHQLVTLNSYLKSGHDDVEGIKILVIVSSISPSKKIKDQNGVNEFETMRITVRDNTALSHMKFWNELIPSVQKWKPWETVLLITNPGYGASDSNSNPQKRGLKISRATLIEIDPKFKNADWLRMWAKEEARREAIVWDPAADEWDFESAKNGSIRILFTLAQLNSLVRSESNKTFTGFINVVIRTMEIQRLHRLQMLMCGQCCGISTFSNASNTNCATCGKLLSLLPNAKLVGYLLDETGCIYGGSLLWSPRAWEKLFGRPVEAIASLSTEECALFEQCLCFLRLHLCIGWKGVHMIKDNQTANIGKLCVLDVRM